MTLKCSACKEEPWWGLPREGDPCWCGEGHLEKERATASDGPSPPLADNDSTQEEDRWHTTGLDGWPSKETDEN